nr:2361_t:CDS:2 [Entrophospora candida]
MPPAIERTIYTEEEELLSNDEILNEPPPPYSEYPLVTNSVVQNRHQAVNSSNNYGQQIPLSSSIAVSNNNPFFQIFNSTISQPLSSTSSSLSLNRMSGRHGARMNFLQGGDITSRFQQELDEDDSCCFAPCELKTWDYTSAIVKDLHPDFMYDSNNQREEKPAVTVQKNEISAINIGMEL